MKDVKKVLVVSDLHLGKGNGYLYSKDNPHYEHNCKQLIEMLQAHRGYDELVFNGDILELAIAGLDEAYRDLKLLFKALAEAGPVKRIVWLPGNHDHHIWRTIGENIQVDGMLRKGLSPPGHKDYSCRFVDQRYSSKNPDHEPYIPYPVLWPEGSEAPEFVIKYPHHLVHVPKNSETDGHDHYLITHGHFLEDLFKPVNFLIEPSRLAQLEAFNNFWLEAFDYHLGHADKLTDNVKELEEKFTDPNGGAEAKATVKKMLDSVYENLKKQLGLKFPLTCIIRFVLRRLIRRLPEPGAESELRKEGKLSKEPLTPKLEKSIREYITKYILDRYVRKPSDDGFECTPPQVDKDIPTPFTFIFGHTHLPFSDMITIRGNEYR